MSRQFSQQSFYEDPKTPLWHRLMPPVVVLCAGAMAYFVGTSTGLHLTERVSEMEPALTKAPVVERTIIGKNDPELMVPSPTMMPVAPVVFLKAKAPQVKRKVAAEKPKIQPVVNPFEDNSIPFRPAEDYTPGIEQPLPTEVDQPVEKSAEPQATDSAVSEATSPIPVAETASLQQ